MVVAHAQSRVSLRVMLAIVVVMHSLDAIVDPLVGYQTFPECAAKECRSAFPYSTNSRMEKNWRMEPASTNRWNTECR